MLQVNPAVLSVYFHGKTTETESLNMRWKAVEDTVFGPVHPALATCPTTGVVVEQHLLLRAMLHLY